MSDVLVNNFTAGEVSRKMRGRVDLASYHSGVSSLVNFLPMVQGGFTRRPGTVLLGDATGIRLIPFILSVDQAFIIELGDKTLRLWRDGELQSVVIDGNSTTSVSTEYPARVLNEIQYAQDYQSLYLAHREFEPKILSYSGGGWTFGTFVPTTDDKYSGMLTGTDCPGCVSYCSNRLWFASSYDHPYRLWASRPFEPQNFKTYDIVTVVDEVASAEAYIEAIESGSDTPETSTVTVEKEVSRDDNAMVLETGLNRNDRIEWLSAQTNLIVGTSAGEWVMPGNISPSNLQIVPVTAYGSAPIQALPVNSELFFVQSGGKRLRSYQYSSDGYSCPDLCYSADHILGQGVVCMAWQRIPEPRLYCVLKDGTMAVLSYDRLYGMSAWARWTFSGSVLSCCVVDTSEGQDVYIIVERDGQNVVERFDFDSDVHADQHDQPTMIPFESVMVSNPYDWENTVGKHKRSWEVGVTVIDSGRFLAGPMGQEEAYMKEEGEAYCRIGTFSTWDVDFRMCVKSVGEDPLTVLSMVTKLEVGA